MARKQNSNKFEPRSTDTGFSSPMSLDLPFGAPVRGFGPSSDADDFYHLLSNPFDPRSVARPGYADPRPSTGSYCLQLLERAYFASQSGRPAPEEATIAAMLDSIVDISRILGIYLSWKHCVDSLDNDLVERVRKLQLTRNIRSMQKMLANLPFPRNLLNVMLPSVGLCDISIVGRRQLVGTLVAGDADAWFTLYDNVMGSNLDRRRAFAALSVLYPPIGELPDVTEMWSQPQQRIDALQLFINQHAKLSGNTGKTVPYTYVSGSSDWVVQLQSTGWMSTSIQADDLALPSGTDGLYTVSRYQVPGTGAYGVSSVFTNVPAVCRPKVRSGNVYDAALGDSDTAYSNVGTVHNFEEINQFSDLALLAIHHSMNSDYAQQRMFQAATMNTTDGAQDVLEAPNVSPFLPLDRMVAWGHSFADLYPYEDGNILAGLNYLMS